MLPVLHRPEAECKEKQRSKESRRSRKHGRPSHGERCSGHRDRTRSRDHLSKGSGPMKEPSPKRRKQSAAVPPKGADEEVVRTYLQRLCDGDPQKLTTLVGMNQETVPDDLQEPAEMSLANAIIEGAEHPGIWTVHGDNLVPVEAAAVVPVAVSTPVKVAPEAYPTAEAPQTPENPYKVPRPVALCRPLSSQLHSISTFARESL